jgi:hypothetical protein
VYVAVRIGLDIGVGMRREQNAELHARRAPEPGHLSCGTASVR